MKKLLLLLLIFNVYLFGGYTQDISSTSNGDNNYSATEPILKLDSVIDGSSITLTVSKADDGTFRTGGMLYFKVGSPESFGVDRGSVAISAGDSSKSHTHDMSEVTEAWENGKDFYVRFESDELNSDGSNKWVWVGPIHVTKNIPTAPVIDAPNSTTIGEAINITVTKGNIGDDSEMKVQCTASSTSYNDNAPFVSEYSSGGVDVDVSLTFDSVGTQEIWCATFDKLGLQSEVSSTTITINAVEDNTTEENNSTDEANTTEESSGKSAIEELQYWFEPYRCEGTTPPEFELVVEKDTIENNNRILELEFYTSGGTQSCVDTFGITRELRLGTKWKSLGANITDLTPLDSDIKYKRVRVTVPNGVATEIKVLVITTLGRVMGDTISVHANGNITQSGTTVYGLNGKTITNENIISKIKDAITLLEQIKLKLDELVNYQSILRANSGLKQEYNAIKKLLDDAKKAIDDIKQAIDNNIADNDEKNSLKSEADSIKKALDDIKKMIDDYKKTEDNSQSAIDTLKAEIDKVIAMLRSGGSATTTTDTTSSSDTTSDSSQTTTEIVIETEVEVTTTTTTTGSTTTSTTNDTTDTTQSDESEATEQSEEADTNEESLDTSDEESSSSESNSSSENNETVEVDTNTTTSVATNFEVELSNDGLSKAIMVGGLKKVILSIDLLVEFQESLDGYEATINDVIKLLLKESGALEVSVEGVDEDGVAHTSTLDINHTEQITNIDENGTIESHIELEDNRSIETRLDAKEELESNIVMQGNRVKLLSSSLDSHISIDAKGNSKLYHKLHRESMSFEAQLIADEYDVSLTIKQFDLNGSELDDAISLGNILTRYKNPTLEILNDTKMRVRMQTTLDE